MLGRWTPPAGVHSPSFATFDAFADVVTIASRFCEVPSSARSFYVARVRA